MKNNSKFYLVTKLGVTTNKKGIKTIEESCKHFTLQGTHEQILYRMIKNTATILVFSEKSIPNLNKEKELIKKVCNRLI